MLTIFRAKMISLVLVVLVAVESLIATFSQDVWNDCAEALADSETPEDEEEGIWCHEPMVRDGENTDRQTGRQTDRQTT